MKSTKKVIENLKAKIESRKSELSSKRSWYNSYLYNQAIKQTADTILPESKDPLNYKFSL